MTAADSLFSISSCKLLKRAVYTPNNMTSNTKMKVFLCVKVQLFNNKADYSLL